MERGGLDIGLFEFDGPEHGKDGEAAPEVEWLEHRANEGLALAVADPDSVYHFYRKLIALRHEEPAVVEGDFTMLLPHDERLYAFTRRLGDTELLVIGNFSAETVPAEIDDAAAWSSASVELVLNNLATAPVDLVIGPWQAVIYRRSVSR